MMMDDGAQKEGEVVFDRYAVHTYRGVLRLAYAAGRDAGDAAMLAAQRTTWSEDDYGAACAAFDRVLRRAADASVARADAFIARRTAARNGADASRRRVPRRL